MYRCPLLLGLISICFSYSLSQLIDGKFQVLVLQKKLRCFAIIIIFFLSKESVQAIKMTVR